MSIILAHSKSYIENVDEINYIESDQTRQKVLKESQFSVHTELFR